MCFNSVSTYLTLIHSFTHFNLASILTSFIEIVFIKIINNVHVTKLRTRIFICLYMTNFLSNISYSWSFPIIWKTPLILLLLILVLFLLGFPPVSAMVPSSTFLIVSLLLIKTGFPLGSVLVPFLSVYTFLIWSWPISGL